MLSKSKVKAEYEVTQEEPSSVYINKYNFFFALGVRGFNLFDWMQPQFLDI